jgi:sec-independent protein translocase protein TatA
MMLSIFLGVFGPMQMVLVLVVVLLLFGGRKIPELMRGLGQGIKEFKDASKGEDKNNANTNTNNNTTNTPTNSNGN